MEGEKTGMRGKKKMFQPMKVKTRRGERKKKKKRERKKRKTKEGERRN